MAKLYWDTIDKGEQVSPITKPAISRVQVAKFAAASQDWSPLHLDDEFAKSAGYGGVFAHGAIALAFACEAVSRWMENGRILQASARFRKLVWPGDILRATGTVADRYEKNGEPRVAVDVWAENQNHDVVMQGQITLLMWKNDKDEKKSKLPWPTVSALTVKERRTARAIPKSEADAAKIRDAMAAMEQTKKAAQQGATKAAPRAVPVAPPPKATAPAKPAPVAKPPPPPAAPKAPSKPSKPSKPAKPAPKPKKPAKPVPKPKGKKR